MSLELKYQKAYSKIKLAKKILILAHLRPDGDAVASLCAMAEAIKVAQKEFTIFLADKPEDNWNYLENYNLISTDKNRLVFSDYDLIIALDCGSLERTGLAELIAKKSLEQFVIEIDHHPKLRDYADLEIRDSQAAATAELIYHFFKVNRIKINRAAANCILTGIITDTGNLLYPSTSDETIAIASEMLLLGAQFPKIVQKTWYNKNLESMKLWGLAMSKLTLNRKYNFAVSVLTLEEIKSFNASEDVFNSIVGFMSNLPEVNGVLLLREEEGGRLKGSLRSNHPGIDVSCLAQLLGGGGHPKASGFIIEGKLKQTEKTYQVL